MFGLDQSYKELLTLVTRPFVEDLSPAWRMIRYFCIGFAFTALSFWSFTLFMGAPHLTRARNITIVAARVALLCFLITYLCCCIQAFLVHRRRQIERERNRTRFD